MPIGFNYKNPVVGDEFFNRDELFEKIVSHLIGRGGYGNVWLYGQCRTGITSVLMQLEKTMSEVNNQVYEHREVKFVYVDCQHVTESRCLYQHIANELNHRLNLMVPRNSEPDDFTAVFRKIDKKNYYIVLLLDEFDSLLAHDNGDEKKQAENVVKGIRAKINKVPLVEGRGKLMSAVCASREKYEFTTDGFKIGSPLNILELEVKWFNDVQINQLIKKYLEEEWEPEYCERCFLLSKGHPMLIQNILDSIYLQKICGKVDWKKVSENAIEYVRSTPEVFSNMPVPGYIVKRLDELLKQKYTKIKFNKRDNTYYMDEFNEK